VSAFDCSAAVGRKGSRAAFLYAFDLLELDGANLRREPKPAGRCSRACYGSPATAIRLSEHLDRSDGDQVL
jgi:hypothetical protein